MNTTTIGSDAALRNATATDLARVEQLLSANDLPREGVREALQNFVVAESGGDIVGVAGMEVCRDNALLRSVAVAPSWRSRGLGRQLVMRVVNDAEARGIHALYLLTTTADRYFPNIGFTETTRDTVPDDIRNTGEFQSACPASATVMVRPVSKTTA